MGYYTQHELVVNKNPNDIDLEGILTKKSGYESLYKDRLRNNRHQAYSRPVGYSHSKESP